MLYRPARTEDLERVDDLVVATINDLSERHGFGAIAGRSPPRFLSFCLGQDPGGVTIAERDGEVVGVSWSWTCEDFWFLAQLFVRPGTQSKGIGAEMLQRALGHAERSSAKNRALITFAFNTVAQGLYIRHGFAPRFPVYRLDMQRDAVVVQTSDAVLDCVPLDGSDQLLRELAAIDRAALGVSRLAHHRFLATDESCRGFGLRDGGRLVGYAYVSQGGHIGPLAVAAPDLAAPAFRTALHIARQGDGSNVSCFVPGGNDSVMQCALEHGMRIRLPMLVMSSRDLGRWPSYLPRNPGFM